MKKPLIFAAVSTALFAIVVPFLATAIGLPKMETASLLIAASVYFVLMLVIATKSKKLNNG